jgi:hypothetical protein
MRGRRERRGEWGIRGQVRREGVCPGRIRDELKKRKGVGGLDQKSSVIRKLTRIISNNISWSTCMNFWSHSSISVVFLRESESSSDGAGGSFL